MRGETGEGWRRDSVREESLQVPVPLPLLSMHPVLSCLQVVAGREEREGEGRWRQARQAQAASLGVACLQRGSKGNGKMSLSSVPKFTLLLRSSSFPFLPPSPYPLTSPPSSHVILSVLFFLSS